MDEEHCVDSMYRTVVSGNKFIGPDATLTISNGRSIDILYNDFFCNGTPVKVRNVNGLNAIGNRHFQNVKYSGRRPGYFLSEEAIEFCRYKLKYFGSGV